MPGSRLFWRHLVVFEVVLLGSILLVGSLLTWRVSEHYRDLGLPPDEVGIRLAALWRIVWTAAIVAGLGALAAAVWLSRRIVRPLQELTAAATRIAFGDHNRRVYAAGHDEVADLGRAFNQMSTHLGARFAQLTEDRQQLRAILSGMVEGVVALDAEQRVLFANDRAAQFLEFQPQAAVGRSLWEVCRQRVLQDVVQRALVGGDPCQEEFQWNGLTSKSLTVHAARLSGATARGAVVVLHDTSELRRLERLRQDLVANVSHELKTPLAVIKACVETLLDGAADDPQHRTTFLEQVNDQADRLHALILDLLSLARIESGTESLEFSAVPLDRAILACLERHHARAEAKSQTLAAVPVVPVRGADQSVLAWADDEALGQILDNLVDNAVKYTPAGGKVEIHWGPIDGDVRFEVRDTGIGIADRDLPRIFERFYRVDKARSRELGGTGLGLAIVKHLVQAMHGSVGATSQVGQGSTFVVRLPRPPAN
jgi:two-component system phosphate regulon sensor histidine kinase PhoR